MDNKGNIFIHQLIPDGSAFIFKELIPNVSYDEGRIGIGRAPLHKYRIDLAIPKNDTVTAFHIGDGTYGFSMGNGTKQGFIPEIIGVGSDETDTGLYLVGIAGNDVSSGVPLILFDGRSTYNTPLTNRPIFGVTSGNYNEYVLLVDEKGNIDIRGDISVNDVKINGLSLIDMIVDLQKQINDLRTKIT
jgi:hypothetical protein